MILVLIHHIHLLMYVPTIAVIVVLRYYLVQGFNRQNAVIGIAAVACIGLLFLAAQFYGTMTVRTTSSFIICGAAWPSLRVPIC